MNKYLILSLAGLVLAGCTSAPTQSSVKLSDSQISVVTPTETITNSPTPMAQKITAVIHTSMGDMTVNLYPEKAPNTVANFVGLAKGTKDWTNSQGQKVSGTPLYQNVIFHRVIEDFMIQGGDPEGTGRGGPGYRFDDEPVTDSYLRGTLAMANAGPNTNGSQFFIVHNDYPLPKNYTIFGRIDPSDTASLAVLDKIATTPTAAGDKPVTDVVIKSIDITEE
ncbi:MAG: Peptidyl-prolyl cis-trans isomerase [Candidatus Collierbacteria bacterium GW2011_GWF2_44_15]|uniref:Peptidyl-prolyl cis-trans isomerase n=2 Tax=Candidatus Collieribacteriota TaxID=1752725 RepID=A0A0G1HFR5_9BACT|nr:MAG: Peptidyl-prolyl cis-trans isomerase [Candidatus Collierbacteria bacterium GW2011_GWA1_44_12]KKT46146.1 MAG: Peptidyl-prolyl cis-trans isomerase [Candidatus Collierbacteria bacterium GW2011_GWF2_44_15]